MNQKSDPKLTAFALGELEGEEEIQMSQMVEKDPELKAEVDSIKAVAKALEAELGQSAKQSAAERLEPADRDAIFAKTVDRPAAWWKSKSVLFPASGLLAALFLGVLIVPQLQQQISTSQIPTGGPTAVRQVPPKQEGAAQPVTTAQKAVQTAPPVAEVDAIAAVSTDDELKESSYDKAAVAMTEEEPAYKDQGASAAQLAMPSAPSMMKKSEAVRVSRSADMGMGMARRRQAPAVMSEPVTADVETNTEAYSHISENEFKQIKDQPLSTFSIDVDTASYANVRRFLNSSKLPPVDAVRIEEMVNYFRYQYVAPKGGASSQPFAVSMEQSAAPWNPRHKLVRIGLKGREGNLESRPASNLVFLIDVSGSMEDPLKLPLLRSAFKLLVEQMRAKDRVAIVVYAGSSGVVLPSTPGTEKEKIMSALDRLQAGGSTNGASGIQEAYDTARKSFIKGGVNRVILATDGDFNVGTTSEGELVRLIEEKAKSGVFLSVLGFGMGNYKDSIMQKLAGKGNGNHAYIDSIREAKKVLVEQAGGTLNTIAKDVKIQVEFNPAAAQSYRLIGYEKRMLNAEDFNDDTKDAGEIGEGHTVTALYEVVPHGVIQETAPSVDPLKYSSTTETTQQAETKAAPSASSDELLTLKVRYKRPDGDKSDKLEVPLKNESREFAQATSDFQFAASVAGFGMLLRDSKNKGDLTFNQVISIAEKNVRIKGQADEYRLEMLELLKKAKSLKEAAQPTAQ
ncbi:MAG: von Willebrand factor type A domain-containing protein [Bdellovibrionales bacterium]|nr:von Willebrand factor type A domain-containing protein [Bdellovibrionales bacterium]